MSDYDQATKAAIQQWAAHLEQHIALLNQHAKEASPGSISADMLKDEVKKLTDLVAWIERPSSYGPLSENATYYGLPGGTPGGEKTASQQQTAEEQAAAKKSAQEQAADEQAKAKEAADKAKEAADKAKGTTKLSFDALKANSALVDATLRTLEATTTKIDRLVAAGKKFNHAKAKADLSKIAARVSDICATVDLATPWLKDDLMALSKNASEIDALFPTNA